MFKTIVLSIKRFVTNVKNRIKQCSSAVQPGIKQTVLRTEITQVEKRKMERVKMAFGAKSHGCLY